VNDRIVGQKELGNGEDKFTHRIAIPVEYLNDGFNTVQVRAIQHYVEVCEVPLSPQLWTQINLEQSKFVIRARPRAVDPHLSMIAKLFDRATGRKANGADIYRCQYFKCTAGCLEPCSARHRSALQLCSGAPVETGFAVKCTNAG